ncbi:hypothetical protein VSDG_09604 [Cytospora chrysosperma]|uniref:O-methyltransferase C-terminal domain-containing protein n=1 Tax=Cytospora chrysosperma TaxID=252740 RepID=A0A423V9Y6_CYTCH|nr:hypothetical protein VSDG_09604 [Valsa sordida]
MSSRESLPRIIQLANTISASAAMVHEALATRNISFPSFDEDASYSIPLEVSKDHDAVLDATAELHDLLLEPLNLIHRHCGHNNPVCMLAITTFDIASMVPSNGKISFGDISKQTPMTEEVTTRLLRHAMTMRIFQEPDPGMVAHTAASKMVEALEKWPGSQEPSETGYSLNNHLNTLYEVFGKDSKRAGRWERGMQVFGQRPQFGPSYTTDYYDWASLGQAQVVFFGPGNEHISLALAKQFSDLNIVIQTLPQIVENSTVPEELQAKVTFMSHDLFNQQPVKGADVYFLRWCLHNWSNKYCTLMLQALVPALKNKARLIIQETIMPEPGTVALWKEKNTRATDINMAAAFNGQERTESELESLIKQVDSRFNLCRVIEPPGSALGMLEFVWMDQPSE